MAITAERLRDLLDYDVETGIFTWRSSGKRAGCKGLRNNGKYQYWVIRADRVLYSAHRLAWLYVTGEWPREIVDHINGDPEDNRFCNLRLADKSRNNSNSKVRADNKSGLKGVQRQRNKAGTYMARITVNGKSRYIGTFPTKEEAHAAYAAEARKHFGEFARTE